MLSIAGPVQVFVRTKKLFRGRKCGKDDFFHCPAHTDKTPSLSINFDKNCFHCFSCEASGNAWEFCAFVLDLNYPENANEVHAFLKQNGLISQKNFYGRKKFKGTNASGNLNTNTHREQTGTTNLKAIMEQSRERIVIFSTYILLSNTFGYLESVILTKIDWFLSVRGKSTWNCSFKKFHREHFPTFSRSSLYRAINNLKTKGVLNSISDGRDIVWTIDYESLAQQLRAKNLRVYISSNTSPRRESVSN